jgi:hypothetical protein
MTIRPPRPIARRLAESIRSLRAGAGEISDALQDKPAQLQVPERVALQSEGAALGVFTPSTEETLNDRGATGEMQRAGNEMAGQGAPASSKRS